jgi:arsenite/tail-anchored protein-transporting ATPase
MSLKTVIEIMQKKKYDVFVLDTAPTGHAIRLLEMPEIAESWASTLLNIQEKYPISLDLGDVLTEMLESISKIKNLLLNSKKTEFIVVTIPENLAVNETQDLLKSLNNLKTPTQYLIINKILPKNNCDFCKNKGFEQSQYIKKLQEFKLKSVGIELFNKEIKGINSLKELENKLFSN